MSGYGYAAYVPPAKSQFVCRSCGDDCGDPRSLILHDAQHVLDNMEKEFQKSLETNPPIDFYESYDRTIQYQRKRDIYWRKRRLQADEAKDRYRDERLAENLKRVQSGQ